MRNHIPLHMLLLAGLAPAVANAASEVSGKTSAVPSRTAIAPAAETAPPKTRATAAAVAFLGVEVVPASAHTCECLGLTPGTGLRVRFVAPQSPAHDTLRAGDILALLDTQILCNPDQFRTLVRAKKAGDTIVLKIRRDGQPAEVSVKLGQILLPETPTAATAAGTDFHEVQLRLNGRDISLGELLASGAVPPAASLRTERTRPATTNVSLTAVRSAQTPRTINHHPTAAAAANAAAAPCCVFTLNDNGHSVSLQITTSGARRLSVRDTAGRTLFDGDAADTARLEALPAPVKKMVKTIEQLAAEAVQECGRQHGRTRP